MAQQVLDTRGRLLVALGYGLWPSMVLLSEVVQTFILADFCYYYVKRLVKLVLSLFHWYCEKAVVTQATVATYLCILRNSNDILAISLLVDQIYALTAIILLC